MYKIFVFLLLFFAACTNGQNQDNPDITAEEIKDHITYLASDEMKGRFSGTPEADKAAEYIAAEFKKYGLEPLFENTYFQEFSFIAGLERTANNSVEFDSDKEEFELSENEFSPMPFSGTGEAEGKLVFAGYGISAPDLDYDDYKNIDVKGKIVLVMRYNPEGASPMSNFEKYSAMRYKASTAKEKGAAAIIFVNGHLPKNDEDQLTKLNYDGAPGIESFPAVHIKRSAADKLFSFAGKNFALVQKEIDSLKSPSSFEFHIETDIDAEVKQIEKTGKNVGAVLRTPETKYRGEYVIIGAHYDHLGLGVTGSLHRGSTQEIHNGADDNASGTTGVLELAEKFSAGKNKLQRSIIFLAFAGEELGLLGSAYFVKNAPLNLDKSAVMINLDMVGRLNNDKELTINGTGTSKMWKDMLNKINEKYNFKLSLVDDGYGPSDHSSFYGANIPVLFFFTGIHSDYHRPSDDAEKINASGEEQILRMVYDVAEKVNTNETKPDYVSVPRKDMGKSTTYRVYVGTVPDFGSNVDGYKVSNVTDGSPAQKGGIKAGDIMINFGGKKISNLYDYTYALAEHNPGDVVDVVVLRDGKEVKLKVELGAR